MKQPQNSQYTFFKLFTPLLPSPHPQLLTMGGLLSTLTILLQLTIIHCNVITKVGRIYLPDDIGPGGAESIAIDTDHSLIFSANGANITIDVTSFDASEDNLEDGDVPMDFVQSIDIQSAMDEFFDGVTIGDITSVTYTSERGDDGYVLAALVPTDVAESVGYVAFVDPEEQEIVNILQLTDCFLPDHVTTTSDGDHIIIACEGEPNDNEAEFPEFNPPGSVAIVDEDDTVYNANFETYDEGGNKDLPDGIYLPYSDQPFSINVEPEYSVVDDDDEYAYITLQENNAIAVLDIDKKKIIRLYALGTIDYSETGLDASDKDDTINIETYSNLYGLRMPDAIDFVEIDGTEYVLTANEGVLSVEY